MGHIEPSKQYTDAFALMSENGQKDWIICSATYLCCEARYRFRAYKVAVMFEVT